MIGFTGWLLIVGAYSLGCYAAYRHGKQRGYTAGTLDAVLRMTAAVNEMARLKHLSEVTGSKYLTGQSEYGDRVTLGTSKPTREGEEN